MKKRIEELKKRFRRLDQKILRRVREPGTVSDIGPWSGAKDSKYRSLYETIKSFPTFSFTRSIYSSIRETFSFAFVRGVFQTQQVSLGFSFSRQLYLDVTHIRLGICRISLTSTDFLLKTTKSEITLTLNLQDQVSTSLS